jgi:hypothetical protein
VRHGWPLVLNGGILLAAAIGCLALSAAIDILPWAWVLPHRMFFEDGAKFFGIIFWASYFILLARSVMRSRIGPGAIGAQM